MLFNRIQRLKEGTSKVRYNNATYAVNKEKFNNGRSFKVYADELGGNDFISFNYYVKEDGEDLLKPCEMPQEKVTHFLNNYKTVE